MSSRPDHLGEPTCAGGRPVLTVVVMGFQNEDTIADSIRSVLAQEADAQFEVVVITSGGDRSGDLVRDLFPDLPLVESPRRLMPGGARNEGVRISKGEFVAFLAADCLAGPGWVNARIRAHQAGHRATAGAMTNARPDRPWAWASLYLNYRERLSTRPAGVVAWPDPTAHSLSIERSLLDELAGFEDRLRIGEDTAVARRLAERGVPVWFEPQAVAAHVGPASTAEFLREQYQRGARFARENAVAPPGGGSRRRLLAFETVRFTRAVRSSMRAGWRHDRRRALLAFPWMVAGALALRLGRSRAFSEFHRNR